MTRKEEIQQMVEIIGDSKIEHLVLVYADWADASMMLHVCEWLKKNAQKYVSIKYEKTRFLRRWKPNIDVERITKDLREEILNDKTE